MNINRVVAGITAAGALTFGAVDASVLNEQPLKRTEVIANERVEARQIGNVVETTLPWKGEDGFRVKYDLGTPSLRERMADRRSKQVITETVDFGDGGFKIDILLNERPSTNRFCYQVEGYEDYDFFYQPPLTDEEIKEGVKRPENIVGSYAVYHKTLRDHEVNGKNYATGKVMHIPRPEVWEVGNATNTKEWAELSYKERQGELCVTARQEFLANATYPIRIDPTFGYTTVGGTARFGDADAFFVNDTPAQGGDVDKMTIYADYFSGGGTGVKGVLWLQSDGSVITNGVTDEITVSSGSGQWYDASYSTSPSVDGGTAYHVGLVMDDNLTDFFYDTGAAGDGGEDLSNGFNTPQAIDSISNNTRKYSVYATYTLTSPTVTSATATSISKTSSTLNGSLDANPLNTDLDLGFRYGIDSSFSATTTVVTATSSFGSFSTSTTGLTTFEEYGFQAFASSTLDSATSSLTYSDETYQFFTGTISTSTPRVVTDRHSHDLASWSDGTFSTTTENSRFLELSSGTTGGAITYVGTTENSSNNGADVTLTLSNIAGLAENDIVIVSYTIGDNDNVDMDMTVATGEGWTEIADVFSNDSNDSNLGVYYKVMGTTPDTSIALDGLGGTDTDTVAIAMAFRGIDITNPIDVTTQTATGINTADADPPSIDHNDTDGIAVVAIGASGHDHAESANYTGPTGYTTNFQNDNGSDTTDSTLGMGYNLSPSDPEDPGVFNLSSDSVNNAWTAATIALRAKGNPEPEGYWISSPWDVGSIDSVDDSWLEVSSTTPSGSGSKVEVAVKLNTSATVAPTLSEFSSGTTTNLSSLTGVSGDLTGKYLWTLVWMEPNSAATGTPSVSEIIWAINQGVAPTPSDGVPQSIFWFE